MANNSHYHEEFMIREGQPQELNKVVAKIGRTPLYNFKKSELESMLKVLQREVRTRISEIRKNELAYDSPAYQYIKRNKISTYAPRQNTRQAYMKAVRDAVDFLHSKTSLVEGAKQYRTWLNNTIGEDLSLKEKRSIWRNVHRAEEKYAEKFIQHGYGMVIKHIAEVTKKNGYKKYNEQELKNILDEFTENQRQVTAKLREGVKDEWATKREDLEKELNSL